MTTTTMTTTTTTTTMMMTTTTTTMMMMMMAMTMTMMMAMMKMRLMHQSRLGLHYSGFNGSATLPDCFLACGHWVSAPVDPLTGHKNV